MSDIDTLDSDELEELEAEFEDKMITGVADS
jgi:hypothetical protein